MKLSRRFVLPALILMGVVGCASTTLEKQRLKSYSLNSVTIATIGETFIADQDGTVEKVRVWVGLLNSSDGWKIENRYSRDWLRKELLYSGKTGSTIEISYREFRGGLAAPAFYQNLKYDLSESKSIRFQRFRIQVLEADNQMLRFIILSD